MSKYKENAWLLQKKMYLFYIDLHSQISKALSYPQQFAAHG